MNSFGMLVPNRFESVEDYRYGFNGKEKDDEVKGKGNSYDFGSRMLDPRVGRWFAPDPLFKKYPYDSPFILSGNSPISLNDPDGEVKRKVTKIYNQQGELVGEKISIVDYSFIKKTVYSNCFFSGDSQISYDYYDSVDLEIQVVDSKGLLISSEIIEKDILGDKRIENVHPLLTKITEGLLAFDDKNNLIGQGDTWGKGGVDFYSKGGEGSGIVAKDRSKVDYTDGDDLIELLSAGGNMGREGIGNKSPHSEFLPDSKAMKILKRTQEVISVSDKIQDYSEKTGKFFGKVCNECNQLLNKEEESTHQTLGQGTRDSISTNPKR